MNDSESVSNWLEGRAVKFLENLHDELVDLAPLTPSQAISLGTASRELSILLREVYLIGGEEARLDNK